MHVNFHEWLHSGIYLRKGLHIVLMCLELGPVYRILMLTFIFLKGVECMQGSDNNNDDSSRNLGWRGRK